MATQDLRKWTYSLSTMLPKPKLRTPQVRPYIMDPRIVSDESIVPKQTGEISQPQAEESMVPKQTGEISQSQAKESIVPKQTGEISQSQAKESMVPKQTGEISQPQAKESMVPKQTGEISQPQAKESIIPDQAEENPTIQAHSEQQVKTEMSNADEGSQTSEIGQQTEEPEMIVQLMLQQSACIAQQQFELVQLRKERDELKRSFEEVQELLKKKDNIGEEIKLISWDEDMPLITTNRKVAKRRIAFRKKVAKALKIELAKRREILLNFLSL